VCSGKAAKGFRNESAQLPVVFSARALSDGLRAIYDEQIDVRTEIERHIFEETLRLFNEATAQGLAESYDPSLITDRFLQELRTNNAVFSAFRTHRMQNDLAAQLIDPQTGQLKSFDRWLRDTQSINDHYCRAWLQTEYDTAVIRAHQAADWKHFLEEADVLPNIRWMPTTSITPDPLHEHYWTKKLTLPVDHPFWQEHRPGERWNCKCSLMQTDEPVNASALDGWTPPLPQPGLDNNPAKDGQIFSDTHPYFTEAYPGAQQAVNNLMKGRQPFVAKTVDEARDFILENIADRCDFEIKRSQLEYLNPILNQIKERLDYYKLPKFSNFRTPRQKGIPAAYDPFENIFMISPSTLSARFISKTAENNLLWLKKYGYAFNTARYENDVLRSYIDHELGHCLYHKKGLVGDFRIIDAFEKDRKRQSVLGYYSGSNVSEYFAECIAAYWGPLYKEMTEIELNMIEAIFKNLGILTRAI
jgi:hypothetical protein